ncbi:MAG: NADH:ubiquinone oxidoreductase [Pseudomonadota bacterium]
MKTAENKNAPNLAGWAIGVGMGVVAFGVAKVVVLISTPGSVAIGVIVALLAGLVMGMPWGARVRTPARQAMPAAKPAPAPVAVTAATAVAPAPPVAPAAAPVAVAPTPVAVMSPAGVGTRPEALKAARGGKADDLKIIKGIGPKLETLCHKLGFFHFDQVASWNADEIAWVDQNLEGFKGRVTRDRWVPQAKAIVRLGPDDFLKRLDAGDEF